MEWKILQLRELTDYQNGLWAGKSGKLTRAKVIRVTEMNDNGTYDLSTAKELSVEEKKLEPRKVIPGSILLERSGGGENKPVGRVIFFGDDVLDDTYSFSNFTTLLLPKADLIFPKYLFYVVYLFHLSGKTKNLQKAVTGIRNLDFTKYLEQGVPVPFKNSKPDLAEQKNIADKLDKVFIGIENGLASVAKENNKLTAFKQSLLSNIFDNADWQTQKLSDIADINPRKDFTTFKSSTEVSFVPMDSVDEVLGTITKKQTRTLGNVSKGYTFFRDGDVIFAKITPCMENGKCAIAKDLTNGIGFGSTEFYVVRAKDNILPEYIWHFLRQERVRKEAAHHFTGAAGHKRVPKDFLENLTLPVPFKNGKPDPVKQKEAIEKLYKTFTLFEKMCSLLEKQKTSFNSFRTSILSSALKPEMEAARLSTLSPLQLPMKATPIQQATALVLKRFPRGEMVIAKLLYIAQKVYKVPLTISFTPQALGPYSAEIGQAMRDGLSFESQFFTRKGAVGKEVLTLGKNTDFLSNLDEPLKTQMNAYLDEMMPYYFSSSSRSIELLATILKIIEDEKTSDTVAVSKKLQKWKPNKFEDVEISRAMTFIKKKGWDVELIK